jgi:UDP-N-acetylmuramate dehydrogenase
VLGAGSNLLVGDGGIRGVVVKLGAGFRRVQWNDAGVTAGAAVHIGKLARAAVERGLSGLEFAEGIPGTVGGALFMNAGAYGGEGVRQGGGGRRHGGGRARNHRGRRAGSAGGGVPEGFLVTAVTFRLTPAAPDAIAGLPSCASIASRASRKVGEAGPVFKNPPGHTAGRLMRRRD